MKSLITVVLSVFLLLASAAYAQASTVEVEGIAMPETLRIGDTELVFNGAGERRRWMMSLYVAGLYLEQPSSDAQAILAGEQARGVLLHITSGMITRERMTDSIEEGFEAATGGDTAPIQGHVDALLAAFDAEVEEGDRVELLYHPEEGVIVRHNDREVGQVEGDPSFREALFAIWLGEDAPSKKLKNAMLGH